MFFGENKMKKILKIGVFLLVVTLVMSALGMTISAAETVEDEENKDCNNNDVEPVNDYWREVMYAYLRECIKQANCGIGNYW